MAFIFSICCYVWFHSIAGKIRDQTENSTFFSQKDTYRQSQAHHKHTMLPIISIQHFIEAIIKIIWLQTDKKQHTDGRFQNPREDMHEQWLMDRYKYESRDWVKNRDGWKCKEMCVTDRQCWKGTERHGLINIEGHAISYYSCLLSDLSLSFLLGITSESWGRGGNRIPPTTFWPTWPVAEWKPHVPSAHYSHRAEASDM